MATIRSRRSVDRLAETESGRARPQAVVVGGGVAALEALLALEELGEGRIDLVLVSAEPRFTYTPLSIAEAFGAGRAYRLDLAEALEERGVHVIVDRLDSIDPVARRLRLSAGWVLRYDAALIAVGARRRGTLPGTVTFAGGKAGSDLERLLAACERGEAKRIVFAVPEGVFWTLPAYELALLTAARFEEGSVEARVALVTSESRPAELFGEKSSEAVADLLEARGIELHCSAAPDRVEGGKLIMKGADRGRGAGGSRGAGGVDADAVVALPGLAPHKIHGLPGDERGFVPIDDHCRVTGVDRLYAAGDVTASQLKQGGIAAQQADAAAGAIAFDLGLAPAPEPLRPELRGLLLAGPPPRFRRLELGRPGVTRAVGSDQDSAVRPAKVSGRLLAPFLAEQGIPTGAPPGVFAVALEELPAGE